MNLVLDPVVDELPDHPAGNRSDRNRGKQRRRKQADRQPDSAAPTHPLTAEVVAGLPHSDASVVRVRNEDHALELDLLRLHERDKRLEVLGRLVDGLVASDENVGRSVGHDLPFCQFEVGRSA